MIEILHSNDQILISWLLLHLADVGIEANLFDGHISVLGENVGAESCRIIVAEDDCTQAF